MFMLLQIATFRWELYRAQLNCEQLMPSSIYQLIETRELTHLCCFCFIFRCFSIISCPLLCSTLHQFDWLFSNARTQIRLSLFTQLDIIYFHNKLSFIILEINVRLVFDVYI